MFTVEEKPLSVEEQTSLKISVCAWCKSIYDDSGKPLIRLDEEFALFPSHGICKPCKDDMLKK
jgi:hypothetical protein